MLDRYSMWLNDKHSVGDVMAESRGREEDLQLKQAYRRVYESGTLLIDRHQHERALTTHDIKLQRKADNIAGLQLADALAHPVKQACLLESTLIADTGESFGREVFRAVEEKFNINSWRGYAEGEISVQRWSVSAERSN
jgi:hypothetical protein